MEENYKKNGGIDTRHAGGRPKLAKYERRNHHHKVTYPDEAGISAYALEAMRWANAEKLINGTELDGTVYLDPQGSATRAQVATILMRYVQNVLSNR